MRLFPRKFLPTLGMFLGLVALFGATVYSEKQFDLANDLRQTSFHLADHLRQSSDDLTRMARSYVATGDPRFRKYYQDILDIRDGRMPEPPGYQKVYWDLVLADVRPAPVAGGKGVALLESMRRAGFADEELRKLAESKARSDALTAIEFAAMELAAGSGSQPAANRDRARQMIHDADYHRGKAAIMTPINEFLELMDRRTADQVRTAELVAEAFLALFIASALAALFMLWRAYAGLRETLGGTAQEVHAQIVGIGQGDLAPEVRIAPGMEHSVLAGLAALKTRLRSSEAERELTEAKLRAAAERLNEAQRIARVGSWTLDLVTGELNWSDEVFRLFEIDAKQFGATYAAFLEVLHPDDREAVNRAYTNSLDTRMPYEITHRLLMADGRVKWVHERCVSDFDAVGRPVRSRGTVQDITARKQVEEALASSETRLRAVLDGVQSGVITITETGIIESFNHSAETLFGYSAAEVIGRNVSLLMPDPHRAAHDRYLENYRSSGIRKVIGGRNELMALRKDGSTFPIELGVSETSLNGVRLFIGSANDISFRKGAEVELRVAATAFDSREGMMVTAPDGVILRVNRAFIESTGYSAEEAVGQTPNLLKSGRHDEAFYGAIWDGLKKAGAWQGEVWDRRKNGEVYPTWLSISAVYGDDGVVTHYVGTHQDITERKKAEEKIRELAFYDPLTRLPNRTLLMDRLKQAMTTGNRNGSFGAVLFLDLDHFKTLNDTLGHDKGDVLLQQAAQRISTSVREGDTVARLGGDEFVVVLGSLNASIEEAAKQTEAVGEKILLALNRIYQLGGVDHRSTASIGATLFRGYETSFDDLLKQADLAMYRSKETGRNALHFFDPAMQTVVVERSALEAALRTAIEGRQFILHYQAQVVRKGRVTGAEVLVRWRHPERGLVSPAEFIPLAEETGLILPLGLWVLESACTRLALWASQPEMARLTVAVNVSARQLRQPDFVDGVLAVLRRTGANPNRLKLELTESLLVDNIEDIIEKMAALKAVGVGFSLDDFGTGYSSLSYLKRLPLDQLKIDQSFVRDVLSDPNDAAIARTIIALAQSLGLGVIAEGVETEMQRDFLAYSGCYAYQGYFFSRPVPVEGFEEYSRKV